MSVAHTTPAPAVRAALLRRIAGGGALAALLTTAAIALWPASEADKARADGAELGQAVGAVYEADTYAEADAALAEVHAAAADARVHAGDAVADQVAAQADALDRAVEGFVGASTTDDAFEAELYEAELDIAVDDLTRQADDFRTTGPEVQQAYWDGYESGLASA